MFQVYFIKNIGKPEGTSPEDILLYYNRSYGLPNKDMRNDLFINVQKILSIKNWPEFFDFIGVAKPSPKQLTQLFKDAISESKMKGYHGRTKGEPGSKVRGGNRGGRGGNRGGRGGNRGRGQGQEKKNVNKQSKVKTFKLNSPSTN